MQAVRSSLREIIDVLLGYAVNTLRLHRWPLGRHSPPPNYPPLLADGQLAVVVYNDELHSFDEVNSLVSATPPPRPTRLARR